MIVLTVLFLAEKIEPDLRLISTIMAEARQRDVRDDQDRQQGQQACMVLPNASVLISFFF